MTIKEAPLNKNLKTLIKKYGTFKIKTSKFVEGEVRIISVKKKYQTFFVDVEFRGKVCSPRQNTWFAFEQLKNLSKIKTYRHIRKCIFKDLNLRLSLFGHQLQWYRNISKLRWVE